MKFIIINEIIKAVNAIFNAFCFTLVIILIKIINIFIIIIPIIIIANFINFIIICHLCQNNLCNYQENL